MNSSIGEAFESFLDSLNNISDTSNDSEDLSFQIFYDLAKIRIAQSKFKDCFNRKIDYSLADIFQDILAHYLKKYLGEDFKVMLEEKSGKLRPDILIMKNNKNWAIIEAKTNVGWNRDFVKGDNYKPRLEELKEELGIPLKRIFYVLEHASNVDKEFFNLMTAGNKNEEIHEYVIPLFKWPLSYEPKIYYRTKSSGQMLDKSIKAHYEEKNLSLNDFKEKILDRIKSES